MNHVAKKDEANTIQVPVKTVDIILENQKMPVLLKIDVEGFETEVIKGATKTLKQKELKAIIIELNGSGARYSYVEQLIHNTLLGLGFSPFQYNPVKRIINAVNEFGTHNTIYIRDKDFVQERVETAPKLRILNNEI
jgi:hypothetical protein